jgi:hypothetical protein
MPYVVYDLRSFADSSPAQVYNIKPLPTRAYSEVLAIKRHDNL